MLIRRFRYSSTVSLFLAFILLAGTLITGLHHHDDLDDHTDCQICVVSHHQQSLAPSVHPCYLPERTPVVLPPTPEINFVYLEPHYPAIHSRAPPEAP